MAEERHGAVTFQGNPLTAVGCVLSAGQAAPDFSVLDGELNAVDLAGTGNQPRLFNVVPSLDTPVCAVQTKKFNEELANLPEGVAAFTISADLPFAQGRFCGAEGVERLKSLSDHREISFGEAYGVKIKELRLLARSVFVLDAEGKITYCEYVKEVTDYPDYDAAIAALKALTG